MMNSFRVLADLAHTLYATCNFCRHDIRNISMFHAQKQDHQYKYLNIQ